MDMEFHHKHQYGKDFFYPLSIKAKKFLNAFPHSSGKRKCLTLDQMNLMKEIGMNFSIKEFITTQPGENDVDTRNAGLHCISTV